MAFTYSAVTKVAGRAAFAGFRGWLSSAAGLPPRRAMPFAVVMVALEAATALAMTVPAVVPLGFVVAALLLIAFTLAIRSMIRRRVGVPCRCFGVGRRPPGPLHLVRNGILFVIAATGGLLTTAGAGPPPIEAPAVLAVVAGAVAALLLINLDEIVALYRR